MKSTVSLEQLAQIPFIDIANVRGRTLPTLMFYADRDWHCWLLIGDDRLQKMQMWPSETSYFGTEPQEPNDISLEFLTFIAQHSLWPSVVRPFQGLQQDIFNLCACVKKFDILAEKSGELQTGASRLVLTELEYLFSLCRSMFDLLQETVAAQWMDVQLYDRSLKKKSLPSSFADMVFHAETPRSEQELVTRFVIPPRLARFYVEVIPFFSLLRRFRDQIVHGGTTPGHVFVTEKGFAVARSTEPFSLFNAWNREHMLPNDLCSLRPVIGHVIFETLRACESYADAIRAVVQYPPPVVPGMKLYLRGYCNDALAESKEALEKCLWWDLPAHPPAQSKPNPWWQRAWEALCRCFA